MTDAESSGESPIRRWEYFIQIIIILSLVDFAVGTLPNLTEFQRSIVDGFELFSVGVFSVEYILRLFFARPRKSYAFSFFGIIDLVSILPFFLGLAVDLRSLRALRLLRLLRILKLARYSRAIKRFHRALVISREDLILFGATAGILQYLAGVGIYYCERDAQPDVFTSMFDGLWWAIVTLTTVGYGDAYPITAGGRVFSFIILLIGLGIVAVPSGILASALSQARQEEEREQEL